MPKAEKFTDWVIKVVMPSIREMCMISLEKLLTFDVDNSYNSGHVYVMTCAQYKEEDIYKIVRTNNLQKRLVNINTAKPARDKMMFEFSVYSDDCHQLEILVHKVLKQYYVGEFFKCDLNCMKNAIQQVNVNDNIIKEFKVLLCYYHQ